MTTPRPAPTPFTATLVFDGGEMEVSETREGVPYAVFRDVTVDTGDEIVQRTVMAFGAALPLADGLRIPGAAVRLDVVDCGRIMKVAGEDAPAAAAA